MVCVKYFMVNVALLSVHPVLALVREREAQGDICPLHSAGRLEPCFIPLCHCLLGPLSSQSSGFDPNNPWVLIPNPVRLDGVHGILAATDSSLYYPQLLSSDTPPSPSSRSSHHAQSHASKSPYVILPARTVPGVRLLHPRVASYVP